MPSYPPGTIGALSGDLSRWPAFYQSLLKLALAMPPTTQILCVEGQWVASAVNEVIANMQPESAYVSILADDHIFEPDIVLRLLDRQVDIVAPVVCLRRPPFPPSLFHEESPGDFVGYTWEELTGKSGLLAVDAMGGPGVVIRREVFADQPRPWFEGQAGEHPREDLTTFSKWRRAGFQPYVDLDIAIDHCLAAAVRPRRRPGGVWELVFSSHGEIGAMVPLPQQPRPVGAYHAVT
jgi:hypothetical protein